MLTDWYDDLKTPREIREEEIQKADFRMDEVILVRLNEFSGLFREPSNRTCYVAVKGHYIASATKTYVVGWQISKELFIRPIAKCCSFDFGDYKGSYEVL